MNIKPPKFKRTHEFFAGLAVRFSFGQIAAWCGKEMTTAEAWGRVPESDEHPNGSGKKNPLDTLIRLLGKAHSQDPGFAREWAVMGIEYVDYLDDRAGKRSAENPCELAARYLKEHAEMIAKILHNDGDADGLWTELAQCEAAFNQLKACIKEQHKSDFDRRETVMAKANGRLSAVNGRAQ